MPAELLLRERHVLGGGCFAALTVWRVPLSVRGSDHVFKYSLAYVEHGVCVLRFDNEAGKGDHWHRGKSEMAYQFLSADKLLADYWAAVDEWRRQ